MFAWLVKAEAPVWCFQLWEWAGARVYVTQMLFMQFIFQIPVAGHASALLSHFLRVRLCYWYKPMRLWCWHYWCSFPCSSGSCIMLVQGKLQELLGRREEHCVTSVTASGEFCLAVSSNCTLKVSLPNAIHSVFSWVSEQITWLLQFWSKGRHQERVIRLKEKEGDQQDHLHL